MSKIGELPYDKVEVLSVLRENRAAHQAIFEEALEGYKEEAERLLLQHLTDIRNGAVKLVEVYLPVPQNHTKDYDRIIKMLEMTVEEEVVLNEYEVAKYLMDDWVWKREFLTANATYSGTATRMLEAE